MSSSFGLTLVNDTSMEWHLQVAREATADAPVLHQRIMLQNAYGVPEGGRDTLLMPSQPRLTLDDGSGRAEEATVGRTFELTSHGIRHQPHAPFIAPNELCIINSTAEAATVIVRQDGHAICSVLLDAAPALPSAPRSQVVLTLGSAYFYRIVPSRGDLEREVCSTPWSRGDWRPLTFAGDNRSLVVRVAMEEEQGLTYYESYEAKSEQELAAEALARPPVHKLILSGDVHQPATQLALLVLLEKELQVQLKHICTASLPLNHPLRAASANEQGLCPTAGSALPFLNTDARFSRMDGSELHGAYAIARRVDARYYTGAKLSPFAVRDLERMEHWLSIVQQHIQPLLDVLLDNHHFGPRLGHRPNAALVGDCVARVSPYLDQLEADLASSPFLAGAACSLADLALLPSLHLVAETPPISGLLLERAHLLKHVTKLQQRRAWTRLQDWLAKVSGSALLQQFTQELAGAAFNA